MSMELPKPIHTKEQHEASIAAQQQPIEHFRITSHAEMQRELSKDQPRTVSVVAAELEHAQEQAARVKPLREELDRLLGRKARTRKAVAK